MTLAWVLESMWRGAAVYVGLAALGFALWFAGELAFALYRKARANLKRYIIWRTAWGQRKLIRRWENLDEIPRWDYRELWERRRRQLETLGGEKHYPILFAHIAAKLNDQQRAS